MRRILVTGGAGFLGQHLARELAERGHRVVAIDLAPPRFKLADLERICEATYFNVDVTAPLALRLDPGTIDVVFHLAGLVSFWSKHRRKLMEVNVRGTRNMLQEAIRLRVRRFVHVSSVAAIGYSDGLADEDLYFDWSVVGHKHYMLSKHLAEFEVLKGVGLGLDAVIANPGLMWGPGDLVNSRKLIAALQRGTVPGCPPGGTNIVDVRDVAFGLSSFINHGRAGQRYILGGHNVTFRQVYDEIAACLSTQSPAWTFPPWMRGWLQGVVMLNEKLRSAPPSLTADNVESAFLKRYFRSDKAAKELNWHVTRSLSQTIGDSVDWLRRNSLLAAA